MTTNIPESSTPPRAPTVDAWRGTKPATSVGEGIAQAILAQMVVVGDGSPVTSHTIDWNGATSQAAEIARNYRAPVTEPVAVDCSTCTGMVRETVGLICQTCGTDYGITDRDHLAGVMHGDSYEGLDPIARAEVDAALAAALPVSDDTTTDETVAEVGAYGDAKRTINDLRNQLARVSQQLATCRRAERAAAPSPVGGVSDAGLRAAIEALCADGYGTSTEYEHVKDCCGEPTCPACWVEDIRRILAAHPAVDR